jgi:predicted GNAT family N-acyltransferase
MMFDIKRFSFQEHVLAEQAMDIRRLVFVTEQGVDPELEYDHEEESRQYLLFLGEKPVATARWRETENGIKLERFAVLTAFRNRGIGDVILKEVLKDIVASNLPVYLHAQVKAVPFYERNGFCKAGEMFMEAGLEHFLMELR